MSEQAPQPSAEDEALGLASALIKARTERGFTQAHLSEVSGISRSAIKGYESGRNMPGSRELKALCSVLKVSPTALLFGSDEAFTTRLGANQLGTERNQAKLKLLGLCAMLALDEVDALVRLATSIAVARHGMEPIAARMAEAIKASEWIEIGDDPGPDLSPDAK